MYHRDRQTTLANSHIAVLDLLVGFELNTFHLDCIYYMDKKAGYAKIKS